MYKVSVVYRISESLGDGRFVTVHKGLWQFQSAQLQVAVKTLSPQASEEDRIKFLQEAAVMGQFTHPNIVKLHGVITVDLPVCIQNHTLYVIHKVNCFSANDSHGTFTKRRLKKSSTPVKEAVSINT